jgi:hypothetical protein
MAEHTLDPYQLLGVARTATSKDVMLAYAKALASGKYEKPVLVEAMSSLTNETKRAEVDVLLVGEPHVELTTEAGPIDPRTLLAALASDLPAIDLTMFVSWTELLPMPATLEPGTIDLNLPDSSPQPAHDAEPSIEFPI